MIGIHLLHIHGGWLHEAIEVWIHTVDTFGPSSLNEPFAGDANLGGDVHQFEPPLLLDVFDLQ